MLDFNEYKLRENNLPDMNVTARLAVALCAQASPQSRAHQKSQFLLGFSSQGVPQESKKKVVSILSFT